MKKIPTKHKEPNKYGFVMCPDCGARLVSLSRHDFQMCSCPFEAMVDGGSEYYRVGGKELSRLITGYLVLHDTKNNK